MKYLNDERLDALSADFVMGTMKGPARKRFLRLMQTYHKVRERVWHWEQLLGAMNDRVIPEPPPAQLWDKIQQRLGFIDITNVAANDDESSVTMAPAKSFKALWWAGSTAAAVMVMGLLFMMPVNTPSPMIDQLAIFKNGEQPLWVMEVVGNELTIQATAAVDASDSFDYELWIVPAGGAAPVSLGVIPESGKISRTLAVNTLNIDIDAVAISRELPGGSTTGSPAEVLYVTQLTML